MSQDLLLAVLIAIALAALAVLVWPAGTEDSGGLQGRL
jgi:hypothetical protein